jgi:uncharacterized membrane protein
MVSGLLTKTAKVTLDFSRAPATAARNPFPVVPVAAGVAVFILLVIAALLVTRSRRKMRARST